MLSLITGIQDSDGVRVDPAAADGTYRNIVIRLGANLVAVPSVDGSTTIVRLDAGGEDNPLEGEYLALGSDPALSGDVRASSGFTVKERTSSVDYPVMQCSGTGGVTMGGASASAHAITCAGQTLITCGTGQFAFGASGFACLLDNAGLFQIENTTAATDGAQKSSPLSYLGGYGWDADVVASRQCTAGAQMVPVQVAASAPRIELRWMTGLGGIPNTLRMTLDSRGRLTLTELLVLPTAAPTAVGHVGMNASTGRPRAYVHSAAVDLATTRVLTATKTSTYTAVAGQIVRYDASGGGFTVNLPAAAGLTPDDAIILKNVTSSTNNLTIDGNASETIDGATTLVVATAWACTRLVPDGANWLVM